MSDTQNEVIEGIERELARRNNITSEVVSSMSTREVILLTFSEFKKTMAVTQAGLVNLSGQVEQHIAETDRNLEIRDERIEVLERKLDQVISGYFSVESTMSDEFRAEKDRFERTVGLEPVHVRDECSTEEMMEAYTATLRKLGIPQQQLSKFVIMRVFKTKNDKHPERMYAEFDTTAPVKIINRLVGNREGIKIQAWLGYQPIFDMYDPLGKLGFNLREQGRAMKRGIYTQIKFVGNKLKLEVRIEGIKDGYFLPPHITTPEDAIKYVTDRGTEDRKRRRSEAPLSSYWRQKKSTDSSRTRHSVLKKKPKVSELEDSKERERRSSESEAGYENVSEKVGNAFLQIGGSSLKSDYFGKIPGSDLKSGLTSYHQTAKVPALTTPAPAKHNSRKCPVKPQKKCTTTPKKECKQVLMTVTEDVCVPVSVSKPRQNCKMVPREECQIMEMEESYQHCSVISDPSERTERRCSQQIKEKKIEVCQDVTMPRDTQSYSEVSVDRPSVKCETHMKNIELKEISADIEVQLPREECHVVEEGSDTADTDVDDCPKRPKTRPASVSDPGPSCF